MVSPEHQNFHTLEIKDKTVLSLTPMAPKPCLSKTQSKEHLMSHFRNSTKNRAQNFSLQVKLVTSSFYRWGNCDYDRFNVSPTLL